MVTYNICYDIVALIILLVIILLYYMKRGIPNYQNRLFFLLILCALFSSLFDIADVLLINAGNRVPNWMKYVSSGGCFILQDLESLLVLFYVLGVTTTWKETRLGIKLATLIPYGIICVLTATTYYTHFLFYYDEAGNYVRGVGRSCAILLGLFYLLIAASYIWRIKTSLSIENKITLLIITVIATIAVVVQTVVPGQITQMFGISLCLLIAFFTLQNPFLEIDNFLRVYNRRSFVTMTSFDFAIRKEFSVVVVMVDDVSFMQRNLGIGHVQALQRAAVERIRETEQEAMIYHLNDSCFCLVFSHLLYSRIDDIMERLAVKFEQPLRINEISTLLSVHMCRIDCPEDADGIEKIMDVIAYLGEESVGSRIVSLKELNIQERNNQKNREQMIRDAVEYSKFDVCYREIYSVAEGASVGAEVALCVMGEDGLIYSDDCKELFEKSGLSFRVGIYLFRCACDYLVSKRAAGIAIESVEVGISIFMCMHQRFLREIIWLMKEYKIKPGTIRLKITESEAMDSPKQLIEMMKQFSDAGVWFSLDGYGTGYSNISYIYELPISHVEMGREVFPAALGDEQAISILKNTIDMLHELDMQVVICDTYMGRQTELLKEIHCDLTIGSYQLL